MGLALMQRPLIEDGMTLGHERMMYADGLLLPHLAACFQDKLCYLFSCLLIYLKGDSPIASPASGWLIILLPASASKASPL